MSFNGLGLFTSPGLVMTPRRTSEQVVLGALDRLGARAARVVDVGTGSGALAIAIAVAAPRVEVWATDSDPHALGAQFGITRPGVPAEVRKVCDDELDRSRHRSEQVPMPNVNAVLEAVPSQGRARERDPESAVFSTGDGLDLYRRLLSSADKRLTASGAVILQVHRPGCSRRAG